MIADILTISRIPLSLALLFLPSGSAGFIVLYLLCGISDMLDGAIARKMHTESKRGARLDSIADLCFAAVYACKVLLVLALSEWIWIWVAVIAVVKLGSAFYGFLKSGSFEIPHSFTNKITGLMIFVLPLFLTAVSLKTCLVIICAAASVAAIDDAQRSFKLL